MTFYVKGRDLFNDFLLMIYLLKWMYFIIKRNLVHAPPPLMYFHVKKQNIPLWKQITLRSFTPFISM